MDKIVKYLLCFFVGFLLARMFGDGFSVGAEKSTEIKDKSCPPPPPCPPCPDSPPPPSPTTEPDRLATSIYMDRIKYFDIIGTIDGDDTVERIAFHPTKDILVSIYVDLGSYIRLFNWKNNGELISRLNASNNVTSVAFHPTKDILAHGYDKGDVFLRQRNGKQLKILNRDRPPDPFDPHRKKVSSLAFHPTKDILASGSWDKTIKLWEIDEKGEWNNTYTLTGHTGSINSVAFHPKKDILASGSQDSDIRLWKIDEKEKWVNTATLTGHTGSINSVAWSTDGALAACGGSDMTIKLWRDKISSFDGNKSYDCSDSEYCRTLRGHNNTVNSVAFSPNGKILASGSNDSTIKLWNAWISGTYGSLLTTLTHNSRGLFTSVAWSTDGTLASGSDDHTIKLWNYIEPK